MSPIQSVIGLEKLFSRLSDWMFLTILLICFFLSGTPGFSGDEPSKSDSQSDQFTYSFQKGDRWRDTLKREFVAEGRFSFTKTGRGGGRDRKKIRLEIMDRIETRVEVRDVTSEGGELQIRILRHQLHISSPVWGVEYDSKEDSSGIYHRIFGPLVGRNYRLVLNKWGAVKEVRGVKKALKIARGNFPDLSPDSFLKDVVKFLSVYLQPDFLIGMLSRGWQRIPEEVTFGERWSRTDILPVLQILSQGDIAPTNIRAEFVLQRDPEQQVRLHMFPEISLLSYESDAVERANKGKPAGVFDLSSNNGVEQYQFQLEAIGGGKNKANLKIQFDREKLD